jgi:hypothetical protein
MWMKKLVSNNIIRSGIHWKSWEINCSVLCYRVFAVAAGQVHVVVSFETTNTFKSGFIGANEKFRKLFSFIIRVQKKSSENYIRWSTSSSFIPWNRVGAYCLWFPLLVPTVQWRLLLGTIGVIFLVDGKQAGGGGTAPSPIFFPTSRIVFFWLLSWTGPIENWCESGEKGFIYIY